MKAGKEWIWEMPGEANGQMNLHCGSLGRVLALQGYDIDSTCPYRKGDGFLAGVD